jgi:hypothetical protein
MAIASPGWLARATLGTAAGRAKLASIAQADANVASAALTATPTSGTVESDGGSDGSIRAIIPLSAPRLPLSRLRSLLHDRGFFKWARAMAGEAHGDRDVGGRVEPEVGVVDIEPTTRELGEIVSCASLLPDLVAGGGKRRR